ncbi:interleukin-6 receptor subunit beta-like isoform X2 [Ranitomeya imitator]|uniref:interleukin-6 receptor subunit beta-like isoform X2 n=1 Tax=Ranitomeya imitator TaxID=111125 RepID=UPI0037E81D3E
MWPRAAGRPLCDSSVMRRLFLLAVLWAIIVVVAAEGLTINSCAYNEPQSPTVELNTNLTAFCILNQTCLRELNHPINSRELFWKVGNTVIPESHYTLVNESVSSVTFQPTLDMHNSLTCAFKAYGQTDVTLHGIYFTLGYPPVKPENLSCVCYNGKTLTCTWEPGRPTVMPTTYTLKQYWVEPDLLNNTEIVQNLTPDYPKIRRPSVSRNSVQRKDCVAEAEKRSCTLLFPDFSLYIDTTFLVEAANPLGRLESDPVQFDIIEIVKPDPPDIVNLSAVLERVLRIEWKNPLKLGELRYNIRYRPKGGGASWSEVPSEDLTKTRESFSLQELQPYTTYTISIRCKLIAARFWSEWSKEYTAITSESAPSQGPEFWRKISNARSDVGERVIRLMWKDLKSQANGLILGYNVTVKSGADVVRTLTVEETACNITVPKDSYEVVLTAYNSKGPSPPSTLIIPHVTDKVVQPADMNLRAFPKDGLLWVEWRPAGKVLGYVIEWCRNSLSMDCDAEWQREPSDATRTFLRGDIGPFVLHLIRLNVLHRDGQERSGTVAVYLQQGAPTIGPAVQTKSTGKTWVTLTWKPVPLSKQNGFITGYTIKYGDNYGTPKVIPVNATVTEYTLKPLAAKTAYSVSVTANTQEGGKAGLPLSFTTLPFDSGEVEAIVVSSCLGFLVLILVLSFLFCNKREQIKKHIWPNVPDPSKSNIAQWSPQTPSRHGSKPNPFQEGPFTDVSVVKITADEKPYDDQDLKSVDQMKTATSEGLSSGIGGSSCLSSPQLSVSESDGISCAQSTSSTVQYSTVIMGGYQGQTPMFSRSESTQPLLIAEERPDEQPPLPEEEAETPSQYFKQNFTLEDEGRVQEAPAQILQLAGFSDGHDGNPDGPSQRDVVNDEQKTYLPQSARQGGYLPQ